MATNSLQDQTPKQYLRSMQLVHIALLVGMIVFAGVTYYMNPSTEVNFSESGAFLFVVPIVILLGILIGNFIFKKLINRTFKQNSLKTKLDNYLSALIIKFAFIEGPSLLALVAYLLSGNLVYLLFAVALMIYFFTLKPSKQSIINTLNLTGDLKTQFDKENEKVS
ncbi:MAG: hypothetical protein P8N07_09350 [Flavobacteriales bacterium]|nr:hypothetical protein [Flavobacteriales bacterium]|tara:strand:+ start:200 stop:697 length:498 start_codon:yes stop_codon:yes gene_type:complete